MILPSEDDVLNQYDIILKTMNSMGYINYEISNFSKKKYEALHNSNYWKSEKYFGFGPSAHSYDKKRRYWNIKDNQKYIENISNNLKVYEKETLTKKEIVNEYILTRIRTISGIDISEINRKFKKDFLNEKEKTFIFFGKMDIWRLKMPSRQTNSQN